MHLLIAVFFLFSKGLLRERQSSLGRPCWLTVEGGGGDEGPLLEGGQHVQGGHFAQRFDGVAQRPFLIGALLDKLLGNVTAGGRIHAQLGKLARPVLCPPYFRLVKGCFKAQVDQNFVVAIPKLEYVLSLC